MSLGAVLSIGAGQLQSAVDAILCGARKDDFDLRPAAGDCWCPRRGLGGEMFNQVPTTTELL